VKIGESVVVWGAGGVGLNVVQGAHMVSAGCIVAIDLIDERLALAKEMGATHTINAGETDPLAAVRSIVGPQGADVAIDTTGDARAIESCCEITAAGGRTVLVGVPPHGHQVSLDTLPLHFGKVLTGSHGGQSHPEIEIPRYVKLYQTGRLRLDPMVSARIALHQINEAIDDIRAGKVPGRCVILFG